LRSPTPMTPDEGCGGNTRGSGGGGGGGRTGRRRVTTFPCGGGGGKTPGPGGEPIGPPVSVEDPQQTRQGEPTVQGDSPHKRFWTRQKQKTATGSAETTITQGALWGMGPGPGGRGRPEGGGDRARVTYSPGPSRTRRGRFWKSGREGLVFSSGDFPNGHWVGRGAEARRGASCGITKPARQNSKI